MGKITELKTFQSTLDFEKDDENLIKQVKIGLSGSQRRYVFVGETHNFRFDNLRTRGIAGFADGNKKIIVIAERDILKGYGFDGANIIHEADRKSPPGDHVRNERIVKQLLDEVAKDKEDEPRLVLILFGQDHEKGIQQELKKQSEKDEKICWWSYPSIEDQIHQIPDKAYKDQEGYQLIGFASLMQDPEAQKLLLRKGILNAEFEVDIVAPYLAPDRFKPVVGYAVYAQSSLPMTATKVQFMDKKGGKCSFPVKKKTDLRLVVIKDDEQYQELKSNA